MICFEMRERETPPFWIKAKAMGFMGLEFTVLESKEMGKQMGKGNQLSAQKFDSGEAKGNEEIELTCDTTKNTFSSFFSKFSFFDK